MEIAGIIDVADGSIHRKVFPVEDRAEAIPDLRAIVENEQTLPREDTTPTPPVEVKQSPPRPDGNVLIEDILASPTILKVWLLLSLLLSFPIDLQMTKNIVN